MKLNSTIILLDPGGAAGSISTQLRCAGYAIVEARSSRDAVAMVLLHDGPAMVLEYAPSETTHEAVGSFLRVPGSARVPYLILSQDVQEWPAERSSQPFSVLATPCSPASLLREIQYLLERVRRRPAAHPVAVRE